MGIALSNLDVDVEHTHTHTLFARKTTAINDDISEIYCVEGESLRNKMILIQQQPVL